MKKTMCCILLPSNKKERGKPEPLKRDLAAKTMKLKSNFLTRVLAVFAFLAVLFSAGRVPEVHAATDAAFYYRAHVATIGWESGFRTSGFCGTTGRSLAIECLELHLNGSLSGNFSVQVHVQDKGWLPAFVGRDALAGTTGESRRLEAIRLSLTGEVAKYYDIKYRAHCQNVGTTGWAMNGATCGTTGQGLRLEALEIQLVRKGSVSYTGYVKTNGGNLNLRQSASTSSAVLTQMPNGSALTVLDNKKNYSGFYRVKYGNYAGYASTSYISFTKPEPAPSYTNLSAALYKNNSAYISCGFDGYTRRDDRRHEGIDIRLGLGKPIYALADGVVTRVTYGARGKDGLSTIAVYNASYNKTIIYLHSAPVSLTAGQPITKGQQIGSEDWRGVSAADSSHTHVEVRDGRQTGASKSLNDPVLNNTNPTAFWNSIGYTVK